MEIILGGISEFSKTKKKKEKEKLCGVL